MRICRWLAGALGVCLALWIGAAAGEARTDETGRWGYRILEDGTAALTQYEPAAKLVFPAQVDGIPVTEIDRPALEDQSALKKVKQAALPATLKTIGAGAFRGMSLSAVTLPDGLETIGDGAFADNRIKSVRLPAGLLSLGNGAFSGNGVTKAEFLNPRTEIGAGVFGWDPAPDAEEPDAAEAGEAGEEAAQAADDPAPGADWYADAALSRRKDIPVLTLSCHAGSTALDLYRYHVNVRLLSYGAAAKVTAPAGYILKKGVYQPGDVVEELTVPEGVEQIGEGALAGLKTLRKVKLPSTLKKIGAMAFQGCEALEEITLPAGISVLEPGVFSGCLRLKKAALPAGLKSIGSMAFYRCESLTSLKLPKGLERIGEEAFSRSGLKAASLPDTVTALGAGAFSGTPVTKVTLSGALTEIPAGCFYQCAELTAAQVPAGVEAIGDRAFTGAEKLASVSLPDSLLRIGAGAFSGCIRLKKANLGARLESLGSQAFMNCEALSALTMPATLADIGPDALKGIPSLTVTLPAGSPAAALLAAAYTGLVIKEVE